MRATNLYLLTVHGPAENLGSLVSAAQTVVPIETRGVSPETGFPYVAFRLISRDEEALSIGRRITELAGFSEYQITTGFGVHLRVVS